MEHVARHQLNPMVQLHRGSRRSSKDLKLDVSDFCTVDVVVVICSSCKLEQSDPSRRSIT